MRTAFFSTLFLLFCSVTGRTQSCLPEGIAFTTQADIANFANNYPGCSSIEGPLTIGGANINNVNGLSPITSVGSLYINYGPVLTNLNGLHNLTTIGGGFAVFNTSSLPDFSGLSNLTSIGGNFSVQSNTGLTSLKGLEKITALTGEVNIEGNALTSLEGLDQLRTIAGNVTIRNNNQLADLAGLDSLRRVGGSIFLLENYALTSTGHLTGLDTVGINFSIQNNQLLENLDGLDQLRSVGATLAISQNPALTSIGGLHNLASVGGNLGVQYCSALTNLHGLEKIKSVPGALIVTDNAALTSLSGLDSITTVDDDLLINLNPSLTGFHALHQLTVAGRIFQIEGNHALTHLDGLNSLDSIGGFLSIQGDNVLKNLQELENLRVINGSFYLGGNTALTDLKGLKNLRSINYDFSLYGNNSLTDLKGLDSLGHVSGYLEIGNNAALTSLTGLESLHSVGATVQVIGNPQLANLTGLNGLATVGHMLVITQNPSLSSLDGLEHIAYIGEGLYVYKNPVLSSCATDGICNLLTQASTNMNIYENAPGCNDGGEIRSECGGIPVRVRVLIDSDGDCLPDPAAGGLAGVQVRLSGYSQMALRPTQADGTVRFGFYDFGVISLSLPQFPTANWTACADTLVIQPASAQDTIKATFLLQPKNNCPELSVDLGLPPSFRSCLVQSPAEVRVGNTGTVVATEVRLAVVLPPALEWVTIVPLPAEQKGDTLFFELGDLAPFASTPIRLTLQTNCDSFLFGRTLCLEAFAALGNPCPSSLPGESEVKLFAQCLADSIVRFTIKNIGDAPTQSPHVYALIRNENLLSTGIFSLNAQEIKVVEVPADGATYRMEATKYEDGTLTAVAIEHCRELTPGLITAFWFDRGPLEYDFDCRQVIGSYDPNLKSAQPAGFGPDHRITPNRPLFYTIDFQNTGTDTAFRVLLRDLLPPELDVTTFRPLFASHPYTWEIRGTDTLEVLFQPIMLPDSNVNEPASHGFFTFTIDQKPDLPDGTIIQNEAAIVFDFNPPILTNAVVQRIGHPTVVSGIERPHRVEGWETGENPCRETTVFRTRQPISGNKRFELYDVNGRRVRSTPFSGQTFEFRRDGLPGGLYFFRIDAANGRTCTGKIVIAP